MGRAPGGFAEYALLDAQDILAIPSSMDWINAACVPIAYLVAYDMVVAGGELQKGQSCLITGASSGVGVASMQIAQVIGARVIGTSSSQHKLDRLTSLGLDEALLSRGPDFVQAVLELSGHKGVELAINNVGGSVFEACLQALAYQGRLALVGFVDGVKQSSIDLDRVHAQRLKIFGVSNKFRRADQRAQTVSGFAKDMLPHFHSGKLKPVIEQIFDFEDLPKAQSAMQSNSHLGKLVLKVAC
jgi:NADPH:quinone reductase-like Zn-dependent oxidoreductase